MRTLVALLLAGMAASVAYAGLDPDPDSFGVYFDTAGNTNCIAAAPFQPVTAYLILMNPAAPTNGFECSVHMTGVPYFVLSATYNTACRTDPTWYPPYYGCYSPTYFRASENGAVVLVTWSILLQGFGAFEFRIGGPPVPYDPEALPILYGDGVVRRGAVASGDVSLPVAAINADNCPVSAEVSAFGAVKGLFR